jgi:Trk-type K+ transport system membrane component
MAYFILVAVIFSFIIAYIDDLAYMDGLFFAVALVTNSGLSTVSMTVFSKTNIILFQLIMFFGQTTVTLLAILLYRCYRFRIADNNISKARIRGEIPAYDDLSKEEQDVIEDYNHVYNGMVLHAKILFYYIVSINIVGTICLFAALYFQANLSELVDGGYNRLDNAVFLAISAFSNSGFTIASSNLLGIANNPCAYLIMTVMILLGNTMYPIVSRQIVSLIARCSLDEPIKKTAQFILDNPHRIANLLYSESETNNLIYAAILLNSVQYVVFLALTLNRKASLQTHTASTLVGLGFFQTISTRTAGFNILDLNLLSQGVIFTYGVMCYINANRFIWIMQAYKGEDAVPTQSPRGTGTRNIQVDYRALNRISFPRTRQLSVLSEIDSDYLDQVEDPKDHHTEESTEANRISIQAYIRTLFNHTNFLFIAVIALAFAEDKALSDPNNPVNLWYLIFELLSAYGGVGLSLGTPGQSYSLSGSFTPLGKMVVILSMILGKHRGVPKHSDSECIDFSFDKLIKATRYDRRQPLVTVVEREDQISSSDKPRDRNSDEDPEHKKVEAGVVDV